MGENGEDEMGYPGVCRGGRGERLKKKTRMERGEPYVGVGEADFSEMLLRFGLTILDIGPGPIGLRLQQATDTR